MVATFLKKWKYSKKNVLQTAIQFHVIRKTRLFSLTRLEMKIQHVRTLSLERYSDNCRPDLNHCWVVDVLGLEALVFLHLLRKRWFFFILQLHPYCCFLLGRPGLPTPISWLVFWCCLLLHKASMFHDGTVCLFNLDAKMLFMIFDCMSDRNSLASKDCLFFIFAGCYFNILQIQFWKSNVIVLHYIAAVFVRWYWRRRGWCLHYIAGKLQCPRCLVFHVWHVQHFHAQVCCISIAKVHLRL